MNENHSGKEWIYRPRWTAEALRTALRDHPVVILTGARQVGKSTLLREEKPFSKWRYVSLDDFDALQQAEENPAPLWAGTDSVVVDEVQRSPRLLSAVKRAVDERHRKIRFVLSGSANLLLMQQTSETLAGRAIYWTLLPMTWRERNGEPPLGTLRELLEGRFPREGETREKEAISVFDRMLEGFMPPLLSLTGKKAFVAWWEGYVTTYLERDLRQLSQIESLSDFRLVMQALALRSGHMLNQTEVSRDTRVSQPTVHRYTNLMEASCLLNRLPVYSRNRTKRLMKTPKVYWTDPGLACYLSGLNEVKDLERSREAGGIFETLVLLHLQAAAQLLVPRPRISYWRTVGGKEVDFVVEQGRHVLAVEAKLATTPRYEDTRGLLAFLEEYPETRAGIVVHTGSEIKRLHEKIIALPWYLLA